MSDFNLLHEVAKSVRKLIECPVCRNILKIPFKQCSSGHNACSECAKPLEACPLCKKPFLVENPTKELELLKTLPKICRFYENGCESIYSLSHEEKCNFRPISCRQPNCKSLVPVCKLPVHYEENHKERFIRLEYEEDETLYVNLNDDCTYILVYVNDIYCDFCLHWIVFNISHSKKYIEIKALEIYHWGIIKVRIVDEHEVYEFTYTLDTTKVEEVEDKKNCNKGEENEFCMRVPLEAVNRIVKDKGHLKCVINVLGFE